MDKVKLDMSKSSCIFFVKHKEWNQQTLGDVYLAHTDTSDPVLLRDMLVQSKLAVFSPERYEAG